MSAGAAAEKKGKTKKHTHASTTSHCAGGGHSDFTATQKETNHRPADGGAHDGDEADGDSAGGDGDADADAGGGDGEDGADAGSKPKSKATHTQSHDDTERGGNSTATQKASV